MNLFCIFAWVVLASIVGTVVGNSAYMLDRCSTEVKVGVDLGTMGMCLSSDPAAASNVFVKVYRGSLPLNSGDTYVPGESLGVELSYPNGYLIEYSMELSNAVFKDKTQCGGRRAVPVSSSNPIEMPSFGDVSVWAGWAEGQGHVTITSAFTLLAPSDAVPTTARPSVAAVTTPSSNAELSIRATIVIAGLTRKAFEDQGKALVTDLISGALVVRKEDVALFAAPSSSALLAEADLRVSVTVLSIASSALADQLVINLSAYISTSLLQKLKDRFPSVSAVTLGPSGVERVAAEPDRSLFEHSCSLSPAMRLSWYAPDASTVRMQLRTTDPEAWLSGGIVHPALLMHPEHLQHSVFLYVPTQARIGRFSINGLSAGSIVPDRAERSQSGVVEVFSSAGGSVVVFEYSTDTEAGDPELKPEGRNVFMWANGGRWPAIHRDYGFVAVNWKSGNCTRVEDTGLSPFIVFAAPFVATLFVWNPLLLVPHVKEYMRLALISGFNLTPLHDYSFAGLAMVPVYLAFILAVFLTSISEYPELATYVTAMGRITIMSFWLTLWPTSKSSIVATVFGIPFERSVKYHRVLSMFAIVSAVIHLALAAVRYSTVVFFTEDETFYRRVVPMYGTLAFIVFASMGLMAIEPIRRANYEWFFGFHHLWPVGVAFIILHVRYAWIGFVPGLVLHFIDYVRKAFEFFRKVTTSHTDSVSNVTSLTIPRTSRFSPGQYYFLYIPSVSMFQWHPFSVSDGKSDDSVSFHIHALEDGSWTRTLYDFSRVELVCAADGPHGCISLDLSLYTKVVFIVGGIGITPMIATIEHMKKHPELYHANVAVELHWCMKDLSILIQFLSKLRGILFDESDVENSTITATSKFSILVDIYTTKDSSKSSVAAFNNFTIIESCPAVAFHDGRVGIHDVVYNLKASPTTSYRDSISRANLMVEVTLQEEDKYSKACVLACGPSQMISDATTQARTFGVDFHAETFAL